MSDGSVAEQASAREVDLIVTIDLAGFDLKELTTSSDTEYC